MRYSNIRTISFALLSLSSIASSQSQDNYTNAEKVSTQLNTWYNSGKGLWADDSQTYWWNSANCLTTQIELALVDGNVVGAVKQQIETTYQNAPNAGAAKKIKKRSPASERRSEHPAQLLEARQGGNQFINKFYDDEGWWALAFIDAYDLTKDVKYLDLAINIFLDMTKSPTPCGGQGIIWQKGTTTVNAIENELFLSVAAALAIRDTNSTQAWTNWAMGSWNWFKGSGLINSQNLINDGLTNCKADTSKVQLSYNQGVILGGLVDLATVTGDTSYIDEANTLAKASMHYLASKNNNIVQETCCNADTDAMLEQFKGIYIRNLAKLYQKSPNDQAKQVLIASGDGAWYNNGADGNIHDNWVNGQGDFDAVTQSSGLDALVGRIIASK